MSDIINNDGIYTSNSTQVASTDALSHMSVEEALEYLQFDKLHDTDSQLQSQMSDLQSNNDRVKTLSTMLNVLRDTVAKADSKGQVKLSDIFDTFLYSQPALYNASSNPNAPGGGKGYEYWLEAIGISSSAIHGDITTTPIDINQAIEQGKTIIDNANSTNQMQMVRLQSLSNTRSEIFNMVSNTMKKMDDTSMNTIRNIS